MKYFKAEEAIDKLRAAIEIHDTKVLNQMVNPNENTILPDWDNEPDYIVSEWQDLLEEAIELLN